jgi:hypothetical protein
MESLLKDMPSKNISNFSHYNQSNYKFVEAKRYIKLKDQASHEAQGNTILQYDNWHRLCHVPVIEMDKQSILKCELERLHQKKKVANKRSSNENGLKQSKVRKIDTEADSSNSDNERSSN